MKSKILVIQFSEEKMVNKHLMACQDMLEYYRHGESLSHRKILFVLELNSLGYDLDFLNWLSKLPMDSFEGSTGALIVRSTGDLYTKAVAQDIIFQTNCMGLAFIGHSVVEIVRDYKNFETWQKTYNKSLEEIAGHKIKDLISRLKETSHMKYKKLLALHASAYETSNTLGLWHKVKEKLGISVDEVHIENGTIVDCKGCPFQTCMHYGKNHSCFYGGIMVEEVLPKIEVSDIIVWVCPNYNDSISANILAVINRLTVLYRQISFHQKSFFAVIVSGNSGSDSVAKQLIGALNINKGFALPPRFALMAIANEPLKILEINDIDHKAMDFARNINRLCESND